MSVYFSRGPKQENAGPIIQVHSERSAGVSAINYQGKKASPNNWKDITTLTVNKKSNNSIMHLSIKGSCQANSSAASQTVQVTVSRDSDFTSIVSFGGNSYQLSSNGSANFNNTFNGGTEYQVSFNAPTVRAVNITNNGKTLAIDDNNDPYDSDFNDLTVTVNKGRFVAAEGVIDNIDPDVSTIHYILDIERGGAGIRVSRDSGSGNPDDATTVIDLGAATPSAYPANSVSFSHFFMDSGVSSGTSRYRLQLQCNRSSNAPNNNVQINADAQASLEVIEAGDVITSSTNP